MIFSEHCSKASKQCSLQYDMGAPLMQQKNGVWYLYGVAATKDYGPSNCQSASEFYF